MIERKHQTLDPLALAIAVGALSVLLALMFYVPMAMHMGGGGVWPAGTGPGHMGPWHMGQGGWGPGAAWGFGIAGVLWSAVFGALSGAVIAWVYNAVTGVRKT